jgi:hypothetical protein
MCSRDILTDLFDFFMWISEIAITSIGSDFQLISPKVFHFLELLLFIAKVYETQESTL